MGNKIDLLYEKKDRIVAGGGEKRIAKQHDSGKLTARERSRWAGCEPETSKTSTPTARLNWGSATIRSSSIMPISARL